MRLHERRWLAATSYQFDRVTRRCPPTSFTFDDYRRWFPRTGQVFLRTLRRFAPLSDRPDPVGDVFCFVVGPWVSTPMPWYTILLAVGVARRGCAVEVLWDDSGFAEAEVAAQNATIKPVLSYLGRFVRVRKLSAQVAASASPSDETLDRLTAQNVAWNLRGAMPEPDDEPMMQAVRGSLARALPLVRGALAAINPACVVVPGGVYGTSGLFLRAAAERGCRVATLDADHGVAQLSVDGVAAQNADLPRAFVELWNAGPATRQAALAAANTEFAHRMAATDRYGYQAVGRSAETVPRAEGVLIPLNVEWDTAALGKHVLFSDTSDWLTSTVEWVIARSDATVTVREHPAERRSSQRGRLDVAALLRQRFGASPRVRFVAAAEPVNTYDLVQSSKVVLPFTSNVGIEAAAIGKPVVVSGAAYYADLGFVRSASSRGEYFELLDAALRGTLEPLPDQEDRALVCYYLNAVRNRVWTDVTPYPDAFWKWCRRAPQSLLAEPEIADMVEAIATDVPVSLLRHNRASAS